MAELLVELSRMIEEKLFFEQGTELKRLQRRRRMVMEETFIEEGIAFNIEELWYFQKESTNDILLPLAIASHNKYNQKTMGQTPASIQ